MGNNERGECGGQTVTGNWGRGGEKVESLKFEGEGNGLKKD